MTLIENQNLIQNQYLVTRRDTMYCADFTFLDKSINILLVMDLASRLIVGHRIKEQKFTTQEVIEVLYIVFNSPLNKTRKSKAGQKIIFHTDNDSLFVSQQMQEFAKENLIQLSTTKKKKGNTGNQAIESLNRTIKKYIRDIIGKLFDKPIKGMQLANLIKLKQLNFDQLCAIVTEAIELYNSKPHSSVRMFKMAPFDMDQALWDHENLKTGNKEEVAGVSEQTLLVPLASKNDNSKGAQIIAQMKATIIEKYAGNWEKYFLDWRQENIKQYENLIKVITEQKQELYEQNRELKKQLEYLYEQEKLRETEKLHKQLRSQKRKEASKSPLREIITAQEFSQILALCETYFKRLNGKARARVALTLLYTTGLRISNLLLIRHIDLQNLIEKGQTNIPLVKGGSKLNLVMIGAKGKEILRSLERDTLFLMENQPNMQGPLFVAEEDSTKPLSIRTFQEQINGVLKEASNLLNKHIRSHSFRATFVTDFLESGIPIEKVRDILGHKSIGTTALYNRTRLTYKELATVMSKVNRQRLQDFKITIRDHTYKARMAKKSKHKQELSTCLVRT